MSLPWITYFFFKEKNTGFHFVERTTFFFKSDFNIWPTKFGKMSLVMKRRASLVRKAYLRRQTEENVTFIM